MDERESPERVIAEALEEITRAYQRAAAVIAPVEDPQRALELATPLAEGIRKLGGQADGVRMAQVRRIWEAEELSLSGLAVRVGWSKSRAAEAVKKFASSAQPSKGEGEL
jgi:hypothetical protein